MEERKQYKDDETGNIAYYNNTGLVLLSLPPNCKKFNVREGCRSFNHKGNYSNIEELTLPETLESFNVESLDWLPELKQINTYADLIFWENNHYCHNITDHLKKSKIVCFYVLPWLVDKYIEKFSEGFLNPECVVNVYPLDMSQQEISFKTDSYGNVLSFDRKTLIKVNPKSEILNIDDSIELISEDAFCENREIIKIIIHKSSKSGWKMEFPPNALDCLDKVKTIEFRSNVISHFYRTYKQDTKNNKLKSLEEVILPLWDDRHISLIGQDLDYGTEKFKIMGKNFSDLKLIKDEYGIIYTEDYKYLVSGHECTHNIVIIKKGVEEIFDYAFSNNNFIENIYIPSSVKDIGEYSFKACRNLKKVVYNFTTVNAESMRNAFITFSKELDFFLPNSDFNDIILDRYKNSTLKILPSYFGDVYIKDDELVFDETQSKFIGVIQNNFSKSSLTLSNNIKEINKNAFKSLKNITNITIESKTLPKNIFKEIVHCNNIKTIKTYDNLFILEDNIVFNETKTIVIKILSTKKIHNLNFPRGIVEIALDAFEYQDEIHSICLNSPVGSMAFIKDIKGLDSIEFKLDYIPEEIFKHLIDTNISVIKYNQGSLVIENGFIYNEVKTIFYGIVYGLNVLTYESPKSIKKIMPKAFYGHKELVSIILPENLEELGENAFSNTSINRIIIPSYIKIWGNSPFVGCKLELISFMDNIPSNKQFFDGIVINEKSKIIIKRSHKKSFLSLYPDLKPYLRIRYPKWLKFFNK